MKRVFAILNSTDTTIFLLGFGLYVGDEVPPPEVTFAGTPVRCPNPKIVLDNGQVVWGCQCWFGDESRWPKFSKGKIVMYTTLQRAIAQAGDANNFDPAD